METRWVYRGIADAVRLGLYRDDLYHSTLSRSLRYAYQDVLDTTRISEAKLLVEAAMLASGRYSSTSIREQWTNFVGSWPYIKASINKKTADSNASDENRGRALMEKFIKYRDQKKAK